MQTKADRLRDEAMRLLREQHGGELRPGTYTVTGEASRLMREADALDAQRSRRTGKN